MASRLSRSGLAAALLISAATASPTPAIGGVQSCARAGGGAHRAGAARHLRGPRRQRVTILRDNYGVPHIYAKDAAGAEFGFGYAQAQDQGLFILTQYRIATARDAETFGPSCLPACLASDHVVDLFRVPQTARSTYSSLPRADQRRFRAFAAGVNAYIDTHRSSFPTWVSDVSPTDILAYSEYPLFAGEISRALAKIPTTGAAAATAVPGAPATVPQTASNMFVLGPGKTSDRAAIMYGDPHLPWTGTQQWYEAQLNYGATSVAGATWRGWPFIGIGTNGHVAWSATNNPVDEGDVYAEQLNPADHNQYLFGGKYLPMITESVPIVVRTASGLETQHQTLRYTVHGPVLDGIGPAGADPTHVYSITASLFGQSGLAHEAWGLDQARTLTRFMAAMSALQIPTFNVMGADNHGHLFYVANTRTGVRDSGFNYDLPLSGSDPRTAWHGIVPFSELPKAENPSRGYYMNGNNDAVDTAPGQINPADFPSYLLMGGYALRPYRLDSLLGPLRAATGTDVERVGHDIHLLVADNLKPVLAAAVEKAGPSADPTGDLKAAVQILNGWDDEASKSSVQMQLFTIWFNNYFAQRPSCAGFAPPPRVCQPTAADMQKAVAALRTAVTYMHANYGSLTVPWGQVHKLARGNVVLPVDGGTAQQNIVHPTQASTTIKGVGYANQGSSYMWYYDFGTRQFFRTRPVGETDDPTSPHFADMTLAYAADHFLQFWPRRRDVRSHLESRTTLTMPPLVDG
jgi:acyl-homoserine-lactone acylase